MSEYLSCLRVAAASAAEPAHDALLLTWSSDGVGHMTSQLEQRPSCNGVSPSGRFPSDLRRLSSSLMGGNPAFDNERQ